MSFSQMVKEQTTKSAKLYRYLSSSALAFVLIFIFTLGIGQLFGTNFSDEYEMTLSFKLPEDAILLKDLNLNKDRLYLNGELFDGIAYEMYDEEHIYSATIYHKGLKDGLSLAWYPDGKPMMRASYAAGAPNGRFQGWYQNGAILYDIFLNKGKFAMDNLLEEDDSRLQSESEIYEQEGSDNDSIRE